MNSRAPDDWSGLAAQIKDWGAALGLQAIGIADTNLSVAEARLEAWLAAGLHGRMDYMARHGRRRSRPAELVPGTVRVIAARLDYLPPARDMSEALADPASGFVARMMSVSQVLLGRMQTPAEDTM